MKRLFLSRMLRHSCCEVRVMQLHDILQLRTSVILPEAISDGGLAPTTDTSLFLTTYRGGSHLPADILIQAYDFCCLLKLLYFSALRHSYLFTFLKTCKYNHTFIGFCMLLDIFYIKTYQFVTLFYSVSVIYKSFESFSIQIYSILANVKQLFGSVITSQTNCMF